MGQRVKGVLISYLYFTLLLLLYQLNYVYACLLVCIADVLGRGRVEHVDRVCDEIVTRVEVQVSNGCRPVLVHHLHEPF